MKSAHWLAKAVMTASTAALIAASTAAAQTPAGGFDHEGLARHALERHIRPLYADFAGKADELRLALEAACQRRSANDGEAARHLFRELVLAWSRTEHLRFGPSIDKNRFERVMFWPDRQRIGERQIAQILSRSDPGALAVEDLAKKSVAVQGLPALEALLHGKAEGGLLADTPEATFACNYARTIAANISTMGAEIVADWSAVGSFAVLWLDPGEHNPVYKAAVGTTLELLKAYRAGVYNARDLKLLPSLGLKRVALRGQLAPKSRPPFEASGLALDVMIANLEGTVHLYANGGLGERLTAREPTTAGLIAAGFDTALAGMRAVRPSGMAAFNEHAVMDQLAQVRFPLAFALSEGAMTMAELAGIGALVLGFSDDDGD